MALQSPFFGKRDTETPATRPIPPTQAGRIGPLTATPTPAATVAPPETPTAVPTKDKDARPGADSLLKVGPLIHLKGVEITDCDTLFVEGTVEATMDSRVMEIAPPGRFKGAAEIDIAEIHGTFEGNLTVRQKLVIHATGKVTGHVRYGKLVIEEGGQIAGEIACGPASGTKAAAPKSMALAA